MTEQPKLSFSSNWASSHMPNWRVWLKHLVGKEACQGLEIGSYEGMSARFFATEILTGKGSQLTCIDTFQGSMEHGQVGNLYEKFCANMADVKDRVRIMRGTSYQQLAQLAVEGKTQFDFIYCDGSHTSWDVLTDAMMCWPLLKKGGVLIFDDYEWDHYKKAELLPKMGIDAFLAVHKDHYRLIAKGWQIVVEKTVEN